MSSFKIMNPESEDIGKILLSAQDALKRGDTIAVTRLARQVAAIDTESEVAWLLLAAVASPEDSLAYVLKAQEINPDSESTRDALAWAQGRLPGPLLEISQLSNEETASSGVELSQISDEIHLQDIDSTQPADESDLPDTGTIQPSVISEHQEVKTIQTEQETGFQLADETRLTDGLEPSDQQPKPQQEPFQFRVENHDFNVVQSLPANNASPSPVEKLPPIFKPSRLKNSLSSAAWQNKRFQLSQSQTFLFSMLSVIIIGLLTTGLVLRPQMAIVWENLFPGPPCLASLEIGKQSFQLYNLEPGKDGIPEVPANQPERAYWLEGSSPNYVFLLSPVSVNQSFIAGLERGEPATITWSNCSVSTFQLALPTPEILDVSALLTPSGPGITILLPWPSSNSGFVLQGKPKNYLLPVMSTSAASVDRLAPEATPGIPITGLNKPDYSELLAEISLLETIPSADLCSIQVGISINNYGPLAGTLTGFDISLTPQGSTPLAVVQSEPALPLELAPGSTQTIYFTFPRPATAAATLKILSVELELEGY